MTGKTYKSIYYHIVFSTKERQPFLNEELREPVYHHIWDKCKKTGLYLHKIGGIEDHVHMLIYIPPKMAVADTIGMIKGESSYYVNNILNKELSQDIMLYWQNGYGVLTLSESHVEKVKKYIENQERHHKENTTWEEFEKIDIYE